MKTKLLLISGLIFYNVGIHAQETVILGEEQDQLIFSQ
jgi:hypothetical protein